MVKYLTLLLICSLLAACGADSSDQVQPIVFTEVDPSDYIIVEDQDFSRTFSISRPGTVSIKHLPDWLSFEIIDDLTFKISGYPTHVEEHYALAPINFTVIEEDRRYTSRDYLFSVKAVNDLPIITIEDITLPYNHANEYSFTLVVSDEDNTLIADDIALEIHADHWQLLSISPTVSVANSDKSQEQDTQFSITIKTDIALSGDPVDGIDITVNAQNLVTAEFHIDFSSTEALTVSHNFSGHIAPNSQLILESNFPLKAENFEQTLAGDCSGKIQISQNNFSSCEGINFSHISVNSSGTTELGLAHNSGLMPHTEYQIKLTPELSAYVGKTLAQPQVSTFKVITGVLISEVSSAQYIDDMQWFEIYNGTAEAISLQDYAFFSQAVNPTHCNSNSCTLAIKKFSLPNKQLAANDYTLVRAQSWYTRLQNTDEISYIKDDLGFTPIWTDEGFISLVQASDNEPVDMVVFGRDAQDVMLPAETNPGDWDFTAGNKYASRNHAYYASLERIPSLIDTNSASDWTASHYSSPLDKQPMACFEDTQYLDTDRDGIADCYEVEGSQLNGISLYDFGARINQKDIFIEVDYMGAKAGSAIDEGIQPRREALQKVVDAFSAQGIAVHFDVGDLYDNNPAINPMNFDLGGGNEVPYHDGISFQVPANDLRQDFHAVKFANQSFSRRPFFHYMLMANSQLADGSAHSSGLAELSSNDLLITLGGWGLNSATAEASNVLINIQAGTIMHELGHNLGLRHGGNNELNYKPNHFSIMNYLYQLEGLPYIGHNEADRYYNFRNLAYGNNACSNTALSNPNTASHHDFVIDYSHGTMALINEYKIDESLGFQFNNADAVDFNCDGSISINSINTDINLDGSIGVLSDYNEWDNLELNFNQFREGALNGAVLTFSQNNSNRYLNHSAANIFHDNNAQIIHEELMPFNILHNFKRL